jgi:outer membrane protein OmpA-like peptidoglycan-associated protein
MNYVTMTCAAISIVGVLGTHHAVAQGNPGYFKLQTMFQEADNKCFEGNRFAADATLQGGAFMDNCQNASGQMWTAVPEGNGYFRLKTQFQGDNKCLEGNRFAPDATLQGAAFMDDCQNVSGQLWKAVPEANGYFRLKTQFQGDNKCLEGNRFAPDATLKGAAFMDDCQNVSGQLWKAVGAELVNGVPQLAGQPVPQQPAGQIVVQQPAAQPVPQQTTIQLPANQYVITLPANQYVIQPNGGQQLITLPAGPYVIQQPGGQIVIYLPAGQYVIQLAGAPAPVVIAPPVVSNQPPQMPSSMIIVNQLSAPPSIRLAPQDRVTLVQFLQRPDLRRAAPSIEIQSINFDTASSLIRPDQFAKVQQIAQALATILNSDPAARFLIEGHTDAVGSDTSNLLLSQQRSEALRYALIANFGTPQHALFTAGFGEQDLLIPTQQAEWANRRVTLRRIDQFLRP